VDGWFARKARVKEVLPGFDGRRLDDLIDFLNYTCLPLLLIWRARILPEGSEGLLLLPLLASVYGFSQVEAKTADGYFLGFPSYWNIIAFYLFYLSAPAWFNVAVLVFFALMTFVPWCYLYSTQPGKLNYVSNLFAVVWVILLVWILVLPVEQARMVAIASVFFPVFYLGASWWVTWKR
jgi:phosphatidylcholine synthase